MGETNDLTHVWLKRKSRKTRPVKMPIWPLTSRPSAAARRPALHAAATIIAGQHGSRLAANAATASRTRRAGFFSRFPMPIWPPPAGRHGSQRCISIPVWQHASSRVPAFAAAFVHEHEVLSEDCCRLLLEHDKQRYHPVVIDAVKKEKALLRRHRCLPDSWPITFPEQHTDEAKQANLNGPLYGHHDLSYDVERPHFSGCCTDSARAFCPRLKISVVEASCTYCFPEKSDNLTEELGPAAASRLYRRDQAPQSRCSLGCHRELIALRHRRT